MTVLGGLLAAAMAVHGQWVWTAQDRDVYRASGEGIVAGIWVATIDAGADGSLTAKLAGSPASLGTERPVAVVIRFDDRVHAAWEKQSAGALARSAAAAIEGVLTHADATGATIAEVQLDYDCPVRRLPEWAALVRSLVSGPLRGREVWITSLPAHAKDPRYGDLFRGAIKGHVLQLFDTGVSPSVSEARALAAALSAQAIPYRIGLGAFERVRAGGVTNHRGWFALAPVFAAEDGFRGLWIFPGGTPWTSLLPETSP